MNRHVMLHQQKPRLGSHDDIAGRPSPASRVELGVLSLALRLHDRTKDPSAPGTSVMPESFADLMPRSYPDDPETGVLKDEERTVAFRRFLAIMESVKSWDGVDLSAMPPDERTHVAFWMEKVARNSLLKSFGKSKRRRMVVLGGSSTNVNHACIPNAVWKLRGAAEADESTSANGSSGTIADVVEVWAARDIVNGEEISVPYVPVR
ncbi:hypothetical protein M427DRAFT_368835 [Gonapodya prolifera JEL478]|uniref:SET domain-containing protein n=1 Tax=Gonapodya prolifera (strain JEL478) TaxID=1344416 RepID=A0A139AAT6_GONPJ|nr:hypothetical protein M427DRAFT_368835 [Gonapodya prolifera JEL478]|eukprot:KXS13503.1 hypothetical protein M427DRAFT_368835 [Gonapodya prolifera JEL478]